MTNKQFSKTELTREERARTALREAFKLRKGLQNMARVMSGNPKMTVEFTSGKPCTDGGNSIHLNVPIELGSLPKHNLALCQRRDADSIQLCPRCAVVEDQNTTLLHEIAHLLFETFEKVNEQDRANLLRDAINVEAQGKPDSSRAKKLAHMIAGTPVALQQDYLNLLGLVSPFMPFLWNVCEDVRVNTRMQQYLPGTQAMFRGQTNKIFKIGSPDLDGKLLRWSDQGPNHQAAISVYCKVSGLDYRTWLAPEIVERLDDAGLDEVCTRMRSARSARDVYRLCFPLLEELRRLGFCRSPQDVEDEPEPELKEEEDGEENPDEGDDSSDDDDGDATNDEGDDSDDGQLGDVDSPNLADGDDGTDSGESPEESPNNGEEGESSSTGGSNEGPDSGVGDPGAEDSAQGTGVTSTDSNSSGTPNSGDQEPGSSENSTGDGSTKGESDSSEGRGQDGLQEGPRTADMPEDESFDEGGTDGEIPDSSFRGDSSRPDPSDGEGQEADSSNRKLPPEGSSDTGEYAVSQKCPEEESSVDEEPLQDAKGSRSISRGTADVPSDSDEVKSDQLPLPGDSNGGEGNRVDSESVPAPDPPGPTNGQDASSGTHDDASWPESGQDGPPSPDTVDDPTGPDKDTPVEQYTEENLEADGDPNEVERLMNVFGRHADKNSADADQQAALQAALDKSAMERAINQLDVFDQPSITVGTLKLVKYGDHNTEDWGSPWSSYRGYGNNTELPVIPERILTSALTRLRVAFQDNKRAYVTRHQKAGRIDNRVLGKRIAVGDDRLFLSRHQPGKKDYFVVVGLDCSASTSMEPEDKSFPCRLDLMKAACYAKCELLHRVGVDFAVYAHSGDTKCVEIFQIKGLHQKWALKSKEALAKLQPYSYNLDGHTLEFYRKIAQAATQTDKIILYYTDGAMPMENYAEELEVLQTEIELCNKLGIRLVGIGVETSSPEAHGLDTIRLDGIEDIPRVVDELRRRLTV